MAELLVSVRNVAEAEAALAGGAAVIDVKEPSRGSLGRADPKVIADVIRRVGRRRAVSAALGELQDHPEPYRGPGLTFAKWGFAGHWRRNNLWSSKLSAAAIGLAVAAPECRPVAVAYGDWRKAQAPSPAEICALACEKRWGFLLDTWDKNGKTLLDWLPASEIAKLCRACRDAGIPVALAGSLGSKEIATLLPMQPDWFAVRGAVCRDGNRGAEIDADKVLGLAEWLASIGP